MNVPRKLNNFPLSRVVLFLLGAVLIGAFLVVWYQVAMFKWIDEDEYAHLHAAYLFSQGRLPYRDFFYFYSPATFLLLGPILIFGEGIITFFAARTLMFLASLITLGLVFWLGKTLSNTRVGILAALTAAILPVWLEKAVEIRPDNPALLFYLAGLLLAIFGLRQKSLARIFASGFMFGLAAVTILKMVFGVLAFGLALLFFVLKEGKKGFGLSLVWAAGFLSPFLALGLLLLAWGVLPDGIYSIIKLPQEVFAAYGWQYYQPNLGFEAWNHVLFGGLEKNIAFHTNLFVWGTALLWLSFLGVLFALGKAGRRRELILFIGPPFFIFGLAIFTFYNMTLVQYFLPLVPLVALAFADFGETAFAWIKQRSPPLAWAGMLLLLLVFAAAFWQAAYRKFQWKENLADLATIEATSSISKPTDPWFDMTGRALFRPDGYSVCCAGFPVFTGFLSRPLPDFIDQLVARENKFIIGGHRLNLLSGEEQRFLAENYLPLGVLEGELAELGYVTLLRQIAVAGKKISLSGSREFFLIAAGPYQVSWQPESPARINLDGKLIGPGVYELSQGDHRVEAGEAITLTLIYNYQQAKGD